MEGRIIRAFGKWYEVKTNNGKVLKSTLRGKMRLFNRNLTSPVAVGDKVILEKSSENADTYVITQIKRRKNYLIKRSQHKKSYIQIIAANIDQALLIITLKKPFTPLTYIDKFTVMCEAFGVPPVLIFNKIDLLRSQKDQQRLSDYFQIYNSIGYPTYKMSAKQKAYKDLAYSILDGQTSLLVGRSGAGKSTFVNLICPELNLRTQPLAKHTQRGKNTTTYAAMYSLGEKTAIIDAPGFQEFELIGISKQELSHYFIEMRRLLSYCKFSDCVHLHEPECAVLEAVAKGEIAHTRYNTYVNIYYEIEQNEMYDT